MATQRQDIAPELLELVLAVDAALKEWPYLWIGRTYLPERYGNRCKKIRVRSMSRVSALIEFEDGVQVRAPYAFFRRRPTR
jgi:hypothetical protein